VSADLVEPFYAAYRRLGAMIDSSAYRVVFKAADGDVLTLHGHRVLHGRLPFDPVSGARHLQDVYIEWDDRWPAAGCCAVSIGPCRPRWRTRRDRRRPHGRVHADGGRHRRRLRAARRGRAARPRGLRRPRARERYRDHPHYQATVDFCADYDQNSFDPDYDWLPLAFFEPMVRQVLARPRPATA